ncbi:MAG: HigA family addiction module antitoxin [Gammaproteobacteria bacterium]|nr:HigA family addiction module antitoxin [Gammaproteobacteria bacterium]MCY4254741.1 HigA family addiction module antitoxin [Gammaproteobacteria bacterium]
MNRKPSHPGALIRNVVLPETRLTVSSLAARCGVARNTMSKIVNERGAVTEDIAIRLSRVLGSSPEFWLAMQCRLTLWRLEKENKDIYSRMERIQAA